MVDYGRARFALAALLSALERTRAFDQSKNEEQLPFAAIETSMWLRSLQDQLWSSSEARRAATGPLGGGLRFVAHKGVHDSIAELGKTLQQPFLGNPIGLVISDHYYYKWQDLNAWDHRITDPKRDASGREDYVRAVQGQAVVRSLARAVSDIRDWSRTCEAGPEGDRLARQIDDSLRGYF